MYDEPVESDDEPDPDNPSSTAFEWKWTGGKVSYLIVNVNGLMTTEKAMDLGHLLEKFRWPSLIMISETDGVARKSNLHAKLGPDVCRRYNIRYSMRSTSLTGLPLHARGRVGGGIALLVHRQLQMSIREMSLPVDPAKDHLLDGHVRWYRLDPLIARPGTRVLPSPRALHRPVLVTVAYVPPQGAWGKRVRSVCFDTMTAIDEQVMDLRQQEDVFALTMEHSNHPDGGVDLPLDYSKLCTAAEMRAALNHADATSQVGHRHRGRLELGLDGQLHVRRLKSRNAPDLIRAPRRMRAAIKAGAAFSIAAARNGKAAVAGVLGARQSDTWVRCKRCRTTASRRGARPRPSGCMRRSCGRMIAVHDQLRLPHDLIINALQCPRGGSDFLTHKTRRIWWTNATTIDHAVTWGSFFVAPLKRHDPADLGYVVDVCDTAGLLDGGKARKRRRFASDLKARNADQWEIAQTANQLAEDTPGQAGDVHVREAHITGILNGAQGTSPPWAERVTPHVAAAKRAVKVAWDQAATLRRRRRLHLEAQGPWSTEEQHAHNHAQRALKSAQKALARSVARAAATAAARAKQHAPLAFWRTLDEHSRDPGSSGQTALGLLDVLNDKRGRLISRDRKTNWQHAANHRRSTYAIRPDLGSGQLQLDRALVLVSEACQDICQSPDGQTLAPDSYARKCAADAAYPMRGCESRPGRPGLPALLSRVDAARAALEADRLAGRFHDVGETVRALHAAHVTAINRDFSLTEVLHIFSILRDVGPGIDGIAPVILQKFTESNLLASDIVDLINEVWRTGVLPEPWRLHRCLLCYKGKNADPCCLDNYRGLGIDQCLLKVLALAMLERLDGFLKQTRGLSAAQGGFQRQRGTPEQIFTLSETVRSAILRKDVHLTFLDIAGAYDSVLHPILWRKCLDRGIYGRFLTTLMAIYDAASMVLELDGERSGPIAIECGVLQGNPLSPALFNMYIDDTVRALQERGRDDADGPWGLPLPRVEKVDSSRPLVANQAERTQDDFLTCLFYADDGVLMESSLVRMQTLIDLARSELELIGLLLNIPKTKWLPVARSSLAGSDADAHAGLSNQAYRTLRAAALQSPLLVAGTPIAMVAYFDYLGAKVSWRWNWQAAWRDATTRARFELHKLMRGGLHNCGLTMEHLCDYVRGKVACHFNYIAAVSGAGGTKTSAPWRDSENVLTRALQAVSGYAFADGDMLKLESGTWDQQTRIDMLLLRFFFKVCTTDVDAPLYRAMCLSIRSLTHAQRSSPSTADAHVDHLHRQPWAQQLMAAMQRFQLPSLDPDKLWEPMSTLVALQAFDPSIDGFDNVPHPANYPPIVRLTLDTQLAQSFRPFRLVCLGVQPAELKVGVSCWDLPDTADYATVFSSWTPPLRAACFAALKRRGNARRQLLAATLLSGEATAASSHRRYVAIKRASYLETYWHLQDVEAARRLLRVRLDNAAVRDVVLRNGRGNRGDVRVADRVLRACYCCPAIQGQTGIYHPETIDHVLLHCPAHQARRAAFMAAILSLAAEPATLAVATTATAPAPPFDGEASASATAWLAVMKLCTGVGPPTAPAPSAADTTAPPRPPPAPFGPLTAAQAVACATRDEPDLVWDAAAAAATALWVSTLTLDWAQSMRPPWLDSALGREAAPQAAESGPTPGFRLATLVARYAKDVFHARRQLMRAEGSDYAHLARDPAPAKPRKPKAPQAPPAPVGKDPKARKGKPVATARKPRPRARHARGPGQAAPVTTCVAAQPLAPMHTTGSGPSASPNRPASSVAQLHLGGVPPSAPHMPTL